ncbi:MAG: hypothetical protein WAO19_01350 [Candidatus Kryptoniota bacterium]
MKKFEGGIKRKVFFTSERQQKINLFITIIVFLGAHDGLSQPRVISEGSYPVFSESSKLIAFEKDRYIYVEDLNGKKIRQVSSLGWDFRPSWSPDGQKIVFQSYGHHPVPGNDTFSIWVAKSNGTNQHQFIPPVGEGDQNPLWSPKANKIVWTHGQRLWIADSDGTSAHPLTPEPARAWEYIGDWSPDGKTIVYLHTDGGSSYEIWLINSDGSCERIFRKGIQAVAIKWSRDGQFLFYSDGMRVFRISCSNIGDPQLMYVFGFDYDIMHFDLSSDEKFIIYDNTGPEIDDEKIIIDQFPKIMK